MNISIIKSIGQLPPEIINLIINQLPKCSLHRFLINDPILRIHVLSIIAKRVKIGQHIEEIPQFNQVPIHCCFSRGCNTPIFESFDECYNFLMKFWIIPQEFEIEIRVDRSDDVDKFCKLDFLELIRYKKVEMYADNQQDMAVYKVLCKHLENLITVDINGGDFGVLQSFKFRNLADLTIDFVNHKELKNVPGSVAKLTIRNLLIDNAIENEKWKLEGVKELDIGIHRLSEYSILANLLIQNFPFVRNFRIELNEKYETVPKLVPSMKSLAVMCCYPSQELPLDMSMLSTIKITGYMLSLHDNEFVNLKVLRIRILFIDSVNQIRFDLLTIPPNLQELDIAGNLDIPIRWQLPLSLTKLAFCGCKFSLFPELPANLVFLQLQSTNLSRRNKIIFPSGLKELQLIENYNLESLRNTNIHELTQLLRIDAINNMANFSAQLESLKSGAFINDAELCHEYNDL
ncbi:hypothetical protein G210_0584 [Candida maltosa Xu316]|uniref:F-box domain-containing protein n=1 Tax=Candida maltosa (strain Xu316) TaxID=1245528 RepID=M3HMW4_CANMX|nr:hypothetical protein G210_0584 [Candida maltosa Xu316]